MLVEDIYFEKYESMPSRVPMNEDSSKFYITYNLAKPEQKKEMLELAMSECAAVKIFIKRMRSYGYEDKIENEVSLFTLFFDIRTPGMVILFLIDMLNLSDKLGKKISINDVVMSSAYGHGFFSESDSRKLYDLLKFNSDIPYKEIL